jgi:hypothetical protein
MKTIGEIAYDAYQEGRSFTPFGELAHYEKSRWDAAAKAIALALESTERRSTACEDLSTSPLGVAPKYQAPLTCNGACIHVDQVAKVRPS